MDAPAAGSTPSRSRVWERLGWCALAASAAGLLAIVVARAWVCDDAYISFRVVDNLLGGYGLRWNVDERVEVYTHPFWLFLHVPLYAWTGNVFLSTIALGVVCTAAAVALAVRTHEGPPGVAALLLVAPLALSRSFVEYSTAGLENSLSFLLFAWFGWQLVRRAKSPPGLGVGLAVGLALWNRLDTLFLYAPPLAWLLWSERRRVRWLRLAAGLSPIVLWEAFRLLYYGFLFPNTKYAKLDAGLTVLQYAGRGLLYAADLAVVDPPSLVLLLAGLGAGLLGLARWHEPGSPAARRAAVALGILGYGLYVIYIGGDFMAGRFWSLPIFVAAWCLLGTVVETRVRWPVVLVPAALAVAFALKPGPFEEQQIRLWTRVSDERGFYSATNTLFDRSGHMRTHVLDAPWAQHGLKLRAGLRESDVLEHGSVGMLGFYAGPELRIVDPNGLTDPLLARLPAKKRKAWRVGHLKRRIPRGYLHARETGSLDEMDPEMADFYRTVRIVTSGPLLEPARLRAIGGFLLGAYAPPAPHH